MRDGDGPVTGCRFSERCGKRVHKARLCIRPAGHDGPCSWAFPDGPPRRGGSGSGLEFGGENPSEPADEIERLRAEVAEWRRAADHNARIVADQRDQIVKLGAEIERLRAAGSSDE